MENKDKDDDFSFEKTRKEVDRLLKKKIGEEKKEKNIEKETLNRVRFAHEIRTNPPEPGFMNVDVPAKIYSIDLNTDAHWWFNHVCTVFPFLMDQAIRTNVDLRDSFKPEKRRLDFEYWWVIFLILGIVAMVFIVNMLFGIF